LRVSVGCLIPLSTICQLYRGCQFIGGETGVPGENHRPATSLVAPMLYIQAELMARAIGVTYHIKGIQMLGIENVLETKLYTSAVDSQLFNRNEESVEPRHTRSI
jgi:hypothetical protein